MDPVKRRQIITGAVMFVIVVALLLGYYALTTFTKAGKFEVEINAVPGDAHITFNDTVVTGTQTYLKPGDYTVKASKDGFDDYTEKVHIDHDKQVVTIPLNPVSDEAKKWSQDHQDQYLGLEGKAGEEANEQGAEFTNKNPITASLPDSNLIYTIGYQADTSDPTGNSIILTIDAAEGYRNGAVQEIRNLGYDPTKFKIIIRDYKNPFAS